MDGKAPVADEIDEVLADYLERLDRGEAIDRQTLLHAHPCLAEQLQAFFDLEQVVALESARSTHAGDAEATPRGDLTVQCPHCRESVNLDADAEVAELTCTCCGNHFSLVDRQEVTRTAAALTQMGRFDLVERVGVGGFGTVWKARDRELGRTVAVKVPRAQCLHAEGIERFLREARAAASLRHPNIVAVHEVGREGQTAYVVSEFVRGLTLAEWLASEKPTFRQAAELIVKIADALDYAHAQGVVHRDLKPANVMIDADGEPHILDFGLARREAADLTMTVEGQVLGTPAYMSPEQAQGDAHSADRRSDVYSLGAMLFELLTGERPFRGNERMLLHHVIHDEPPSLSSLNSNVPKDLETVALKCLEKSPASRYQTAGELAADLRRWLNHEPIAAHPIGPARRLWRWYAPRTSIVAGAFSIFSAMFATTGISAVFVIALAHQYLRHRSSVQSTARLGAVVAITAWAALIGALFWGGLSSIRRRKGGLLLSFALFGVYALIGVIGLVLLIAVDSESLRDLGQFPEFEELIFVHNAGFSLVWCSIGAMLQYIALRRFDADEQLLR